jgi:hypothetical protein
MSSLNGSANSYLEILKSEFLTIASNRVLDFGNAKQQSAKPTERGGGIKLSNLLFEI